MKLDGHCFCECEDGVYHTYEESAIDAALTSAFELGELKPGVKLSYWRGDVVDYVSSDFITDHRIENFFEDLNCAACDEVGEAADDFGYHSPEAGEELKKLLKDWMDKNVACTFYGVRNVVEIKFTVTQQMFDEFTA